MSQNLVSLFLTPEQLDAIDGALTTLEGNLAGLIALDVARRRTLTRMGDKSEVFCRQTIRVLDQNRQVVPPSLALDEAQADLDALDQLRPRMLRLQRLSERANDTETALGSDVMACALQGYALLKVAGKNQGLDGLRKELGYRFAKSSRSNEAEPA